MPFNKEEVKASKRKSTKPTKVPAGKKKKRKISEGLTLRTPPEFITNEAGGTAAEAPITPLPSFIPSVSTEVNEPLIQDMHTNVEQKNALNNYITPIIEEVATKSPTALGIEQSTQTDLSPGIEDASTRTTSLFAFCPIHFAHLKEKVTLKGDFHFMKCLVEDCFLFCAKDSTDFYLQSVQGQLHRDIKESWQTSPLCCFCNKVLTLKQSC